MFLHAESPVPEEAMRPGKNYIAATLRQAQRLQLNGRNGTL
jgi:hypothetical protein